MKEDINGKIAAVRAAISDDDTDRIKSSIGGTQHCPSSGRPGRIQPAGRGAEASADDDVDETTNEESDGDDDSTVEGEFREVK